MGSWRTTWGCYRSTPSYITPSSPPDIRWPGSREPVSPRAPPLTDIFLWLPVFMPPEFEIVRHADGEEAHILQVIPVYTAERAYARDNGPQALLDAFSQKDADVSDLHRPSAVRSSSPTEENLTVGHNPCYQPVLQAASLPCLSRGRSW